MKQRDDGSFIGGDYYPNDLGPVKIEDVETSRRRRSPGGIEPLVSGAAEPDRRPRSARS